MMTLDIVDPKTGKLSLEPYRVLRCGVHADSTACFRIYDVQPHHCFQSNVRYLPVAPARTMRSGEMEGFALVDLSYFPDGGVATHFPGREQSAPNPPTAAHGFSRRDLRTIQLLPPAAGRETVANDSASPATTPAHCRLDLKGAPTRKALRGPSAADPALARLWLHNPRPARSISRRRTPMQMFQQRKYEL